MTLATPVVVVPMNSNIPLSILLLVALLMIPLLCSPGNGRGRALAWTNTISISSTTLLDVRTSRSWTTRRVPIRPSSLPYGVVASSLMFLQRHGERRQQQHDRRQAVLVLNMMIQKHNNHIQQSFRTSSSTAAIGTQTTRRAIPPPPPTTATAATTTRRWLGTKPGSHNPPIPGEIHIENELEEEQQQQQRNDNDKTIISSPVLDFNQLRNTISIIRDWIGYTTYDISIFLVNDTIIQKANREYRGIAQPTDILSFPFHESIRPGVLCKPEFDSIPDYYNLGDILIDIPYIIRSCQWDYEQNQHHHQQQIKNPQQGTHDETAKNVYNKNNNSTQTNESLLLLNKDDMIDDYYHHHDDSRGVSGAMATVYNPEQRIHMLLIHGMLHLVGYDHETDEDYELMVSKEMELLEVLLPIIQERNIP